MFFTETKKSFIFFYAHVFFRINHFVYGFKLEIYFYTFEKDRKNKNFVEDLRDRKLKCFSVQLTEN